MGQQHDLGLHNLNFLCAWLEYWSLAKLLFFAIWYTFGVTKRLNQNLCYGLYVAGQHDDGKDRQNESQEAGKEICVIDELYSYCSIVQKSW